MNLRPDLRRQLRNLLFCLGMILVGTMAIGVAWFSRENARAEEQQARAEDSAFQARLARILQEEKEIQAGDQLFRQWQARGILGEEKRVDWIETIGRIREQRRLADIEWEISPQRPLENAFMPSRPASLDFVASSLRLRLPLLHGEDLLRLLTDLNQELPAIVRVRACDIMRSQASQQAGIRSWPLQANCQVDLITARLKEPK